MACNGDGRACEELGRARGCPDSVLLQAAGRHRRVCSECGSLMGAEGCPRCAGLARHCRHCGGFLTRVGDCNNPRCKGRALTSLPAFQELADKHGVGLQDVTWVHPERFAVPEDVRSFVHEIQAAGGDCFLVGGGVRDTWLGTKCDDWDFEVGGISQEELERLLRPYYSNQDQDPAAQGRFGAYILRIGNHKIDVTLRRTETSTGKGYKDVEVNIEGVGLYEATLRRDYTYNAMMADIDNGLIVDFHGGIQDLRRRVLRPTSEQFAESTERVLRGMRQAAKYGLRPSGDLIEVSREMKRAYHGLVGIDGGRGKIWKEWRKLALSPEPSLGLKFLRETQWDNLYPGLRDLQGLPQDPEHHPEGDAWAHELHTADAAAYIARRDGCNAEETTILVLTSITHDFGKPETIAEREGDITFYGHAQQGVQKARQFLRSIGAPPDLHAPVLALVREHMSFVGQSPETITEAAVGRLADRLEPATIHQWARLVEADHAGRPPLPAEPPAFLLRIKEIAAQLGVLDGAPPPILMGRHLVYGPKALLKPGPKVGKVLQAARAAQLKGKFSDLPGAKSWVRQYLGLPPDQVLSGRHLIEAGLMQPGPQMGQVLQAAHEAEQAGVFLDVADGLRWVRQHLEEKAGGL